MSSTHSYPHRHEPGCSLVRRGTHWHTPQGLQGGWRCSRNAVLSVCRREISQCRARLAAGRTPGSTGSHPGPVGLLRDTRGREWSSGTAFHTAGTTPAGTNHKGTGYQMMEQQDYYCHHNSFTFTTTTIISIIVNIFSSHDCFHIRIEENICGIFKNCKLRSNTVRQNHYFLLHKELEHGKDLDKHCLT